jgi:hypothetical protein
MYVIHDTETRSRLGLWGCSQQPVCIRFVIKVVVAGFIETTRHETVILTLSLSHTLFVLVTTAYKADRE